MYHIFGSRLSEAGTGEGWRRLDEHFTSAQRRTMNNLTDRICGNWAQEDRYFMIVCSRTSRINMYHKGYCLICDIIH